MDYQMPTLESLIALAHGELKESYQKHNSQRLSFIRFYENLARKLLKTRSITRLSHEESEEIRELLTAALMFEYAWIVLKEYGGKPPDHFSNRISKTVYSLFNKQDQLGSQFYIILKAILEEMDKPLTYRICLTYVNKLYFYVYKNAYQESLLFPKDKNFSIWKTKNVILDDMLLVLNKITEKEWNRITPELSSSPTQTAITNNIRDGSNQYRKIVASRSYLGRWLTKTSHIDASYFADFINETCRELSLNCDEDSLKRIQSGAMLYILLTIYNEYSVLSPQLGSDLFIQCLQALNAKGMWKMDLEMQTEDLNALFAYVTEIRHHKKYDLLAKEWKTRGLDLDNYLKLVLKTIPEQQVQLRSPWWYETLFNYSVQYGAGAAVVRYGLPALGRLAIGSMSGPVGIIFYIAGSTIFLTQLGVIVSNNVIPRAVLYVYGCALEKVGNKATDTANSFAKTANQKIQTWWGYERLSQEDKDDLEDYIQNTLLQLPQGVLSEKDKEQIRVVFGFENKQLIAPLSLVELEMDEFVEIEKRKSSP